MEEGGNDDDCHHHGINTNEGGGGEWKRKRLEIGGDNMESTLTKSKRGNFYDNIMC